LDHNHNHNHNHNKQPKGGTTKSATAATKLAIMEGENGPFCRGLSETKVTSASDLLELMQIAHRQRQTGETDMNKESSRSHCIFTLRVEAKRQLVDGSILEVAGKLHCVDLAGSECAKSCGNAGKQQAARERERMNINRSLLTLGRVVKLLKEKSQGNAGGNSNSNSNSSNVRIPYRDSKLTRILQESLGGRCKTCLIATISPSVTAIEESMSTLNYAQAANGIVNKPVTTSLMSVGSSLSSSLSGNSSSSSSGGAFSFDTKSAEGTAGGTAAGVSVEHWHEMECRLEYMQSQVDEAQQALARKHIQQQELVDRAEQAEFARQLAERNFEKATHEITVLGRRVKDTEEQLEEHKRSLRETKAVLEATQQTEVALTKEATALIQVLTTTISDGDRMHNELVSKRKEEIDRKTATKHYQANQISLLHELLQNLEEIQKAQQKHRLHLETTRNERNSRELEFLEEHSLAVEQMRNDCVAEIQALRESTQIKLLPIVQRLIASSNEKMNRLAAILKDGDGCLQTNCQSILDRLTSNTNRIAELETEYRSSSERILDTLDTQLRASKENLSLAVAEITAALQDANANRQLQRVDLNKKIVDFRNRSRSSIHEMGSLASSHTTVLNDSVREIKDGQEQRSNILDSISNMDEYLASKNNDYATKLEKQCSVLKQQHETFLASHQKQQQMNRLLVAKVMGGIQSLIETEIQSMDRFQSETYDSFLATNGESKSCNDVLHQTTSDVFGQLGQANAQLKIDVGQDFDKQNQLGATLEQESSKFDASMNTAIEGLCKPLDAFVRDSKDALQTHETEDLTATNSIIEKARTQIETATHQLTSSTQQAAEQGMSELQESAAQGWSYVREEVIQPLRNDLVERIQAPQSSVHANAQKELTAIEEKLDCGEKAVEEQVSKGLEYASSAEQCLEVGVNETFAASIKQHRDHIEESEWLETTLQEQNELVGDRVSSSTHLVSSCSKQVDGLAHDVHRVDEEPANIPERNVPVYSEELTSTNDPRVILREAGLCDDDDDDENENDEENCENVKAASVTSRKIASIKGDRNKSSSAFHKNPVVLKDRSSSVNSTPSSTSRIKNIIMNTNDSPPLKRVAADTGNTLTNFSNGLRKRSKRSKAAKK